LAKSDQEKIMKPLHLIRGAGRSAAPVALLASFAVPSTAQTQLAQSAYPAAFTGLDCTRCAAGQYCVVNPFRFEYACAPLGTYACIGVSRTSWCRYGTSCWDGACR
jgi:hypothetical protein